MQAWDYYIYGMGDIDFFKACKEKDVGVIPLYLANETNIAAIFYMNEGIYYPQYDYYNNIFKLIMHKTSRKYIDKILSYPKRMTIDEYDRLKTDRMSFLLGGSIYKMLNGNDTIKIFEKLSERLELPFVLNYDHLKVTTYPFDIVLKLLKRKFKKQEYETPITINSPTVINISGQDYLVQLFTKNYMYSAKLVSNPRHYIYYKLPLKKNIKEDEIETTNEDYFYYLVKIANNLQNSFEVIK